jgi:hypothetical protein
MAYTVDTLDKSLYAEEFHAADFLAEPGVAVLKALTLQFQPAFMDILPLYIVLLTVFPLVLAGFRLRPGLVLLASLGLWLAVQLDQRIALSAYPGPDRVWFFNPFAWQALFFRGTWLGWQGTRGEIPWLRARWLVRLAVVLALTGLVIRFSWTLHGLYDPIPALVSGKPLWRFLSKQDLGLLRFANVLALSLLVALLIEPRGRIVAARAAWPFVVCGRNSLHIFCLGILLSVIGHLVLNEFFGGIFMQLLVSAAGIAIMIAIAFLMEWFATAQEPSGHRAPERAPAGGGES